MNQQDIPRLMAMLCAAYPSTSVSAATIAIYSQKLARFSVEQVTKAVSDHIDQGKKFPTIAELSERAGRVQSQPERARLPEWKHTQFAATPSDLIGRDGVNRGYPNAAYREARHAMLERLRERFPTYRPPSEREWAKAVTA